MKRKQTLIIGRGLAGSLLARELLKNGCSVDTAQPSTQAGASRLAGGLFSPITGKRWVRTWQDTLLLPLAHRYYRALEQETGARVYHPRPILRLFTSDDDIQRVRDQADEDPQYAAYITGIRNAGDLPEDIDAPLGAAELAGGGHVDLAALLDTLRVELEKQNALAEAYVDYRDLEIRDGLVRWNERTYDQVVFCEGYRATGNPWFDGIPYRHAKGEILTLSIPGWNLEEIVSAGVFILPLGSGLFRVGSTYEWNDLDEQPTDAGREELLHRFRAICSRAFTVVDHRAGVRPIAFDRAPVAGRHPEHPRLAILNGFGSKGVLYAPWTARMLADHLEHGAPMDPKVSVETHWKPERLKQKGPAKPR